MSRAGGSAKLKPGWPHANHHQAPWVGIDDSPFLYRSGAAVVACHDQFGVRETALLLEAVRDPAAFALNYPVGGRPTPLKGPGAA